MLRDGVPGSPTSLGLARSRRRRTAPCGCGVPGLYRRGAPGPLAGCCWSLSGRLGLVRGTGPAVGGGSGSNAPRIWLLCVDVICTVRSNGPRMQVLAQKTCMPSQGCDLRKRMIIWPNAGFWPFSAPVYRKAYGSCIPLWPDCLCPYVTTKKTQKNLQTCIKTWSEGVRGMQVSCRFLDFDAGSGL